MDGGVKEDRTPDLRVANEKLRVSIRCFSRGRNPTLSPSWGNRDHL